MKFPTIITKILSGYFRWLASAVVGAILIFGYAGLISDKLQTIRTTGFLEQKKVQAELDNRRQFLAELQESVQRFEAAFPPSKLQALSEFIPSSADFPGLLLTLRNIAAAANLQLDSITIGEVGQLAATGPTASVDVDGGQATAAPAAAQAAAAAGVNLQVQNASITVSGGQSYASFKNFVALIESSQRLLDVVSLSFTLGSEAAGQGLSGNYSLQVRTYYLPPV